MFYDIIIISIDKNRSIPLLKKISVFVENYCWSNTSSVGLGKMAALPALSYNERT